MFKKILNFTFALLLSLSSIPFETEATNLKSSYETPREVREKKRMLWEIEDIKEIFEAGYAPAEWKESRYGWNLNDRSNEAYQEVKNNPEASKEGYRLVMKQFFNSMKDYHVSIRFLSTERAILPFTVGSAEGRYFVNYVHDIAQKMNFPFRVGDEIITFDGRPIDEVVQEFILTNERQATEGTDQGFGEMYLTNRFKSSGVEVPSGFVDVQGYRKGDQNLISCRMKWMYMPDNLDNDREFLAEREQKKIQIHKNMKGMTPPPPLSVPEDANDTTLQKIEKFLDERPHAVPYFEQMKMESLALMENPNTLGSRKSPLPKLGKVLWEGDDEVAYDSYLYQGKGGMKVGYVRIPTFSLKESDAFDFERIIRFLESESDMLVVDQLNNPGGSVFHMFALASMLTDKPLNVPLEQYRVDEEDALKAQRIVSSIDVDLSRMDEDTEMEGTIGGYPITYEFYQSHRDYWQFIADQGMNGNKLSDLYNSFGVEAVKPHSRVRYTKPILILINSMDISCGDFFPAMFQDSDTNVTLLGSRTSGAGGAVKQKELYSATTLGMSYTWTIAMRSNGMPIENLGVEPDVPYDLTARDLSDNYLDFQQKIEETLQEIKNNS
jgi:hypothetical protein